MKFLGYVTKKVLDYIILTLFLCQGLKCFDVGVLSLFTLSHRKSCSSRFSECGHMVITRFPQCPRVRDGFSRMWNIHSRTVIINLIPYSSEPVRFLISYSLGDYPYVFVYSLMLYDSARNTNLVIWLPLSTLYFDPFTVCGTKVLGNYRRFVSLNSITVQLPSKFSFQRDLSWNKQSSVTCLPI